MAISPRTRIVELLIATSGLVLAQAAMAQTASAPDTGPGATPDTTGVSPLPAAASTKDGRGDDIVVTGSRIASADSSSYAPLISVSADNFDRTGAISLEQTINALPQFVGQNTATSNDNLLGAVNTLSLRGLGGSRTLVLLDGHRLTPALPDGSVDISNIPEALLSNVEIITGGASTTYGSDAVAGVVNFKLNRNFTGVSLNMQNGISDRGDAGTQRISLAAGTKFGGGRGRALLGLTYSHRDGLYDYDRDFARLGRPSSNLPQGAARADSSNLPSQATVDSVFSRYGVAAGTVSASSPLGLNGDGSLFQFANGSANYRGATDNYIITPSSLRYSSGSQNGLLTPYNKLAAYGYADYEVTPGVTVYGQANFLTYTSSQTYPAASAALSVPVTNPFIPSDLATILASRADPTAPFTLAKRYAQFGNRVANYRSTSYDLSGGIRGNLPFGDWTFDLFGEYGSVHLIRKASGTLDTDAVQTLLSASDGGASLCSGGFDFVGTAMASQSCIDYATRTVRTDTTFRQRMGELDLQGGLFDLTGAGMIRAAIGAAYRSNSYDYEPDPLLLTDSSLISFGDATAATSGTVTTKEVYGELAIPLVKDVFLIKRLSANLGVRYSDYNTSGGFVTWKASGLWSPVTGIEIRGGYARAIRSPGVDDLFSPQTQSFVTIGTAGTAGQGDPCDVTGAYRTGANAAAVRQLCLAQGIPASLIDSYTYGDSQTSAGVAGGNPNLAAERAKTITAGITIAPKFSSPWLSGVSLSVDYYHIKIDGAVVSLQGSDILQRCFNYDGTTNPTYSESSLYCSLLRRDTTTGQISYLAENAINAGQLVTSGIDLTARWRIALDAIGLSPASAITLSTTVGWLDKFTLRNFPTDAAIDFAGSIGYGGIRSAHPKWKALTNLTYSNGGFEAGVQWRYIDKMIDVASIGVSDSGIPGVPSVNYFDVNLRYALNDNYTMRFGVTNIGDKQPPTYLDNAQANTDPSTYDVVGRAFYVGVGIKF